MDAHIIREQLFQKYIAPTRRKKKGYIGVEIEIPIINTKKKPVDFSVVHEITGHFMAHFFFHPEKHDDEGHIYLASDPVTGDILSMVCSPVRPKCSWMWNMRNY